MKILFISSASFAVGMLISMFVISVIDNPIKFLAICAPLNLAIIAVAQGIFSTAKSEG